MFEFPKIENCTIFPLPEGTNLEFKISFNSSMAEKIYATICGILNSGGGYLVIGIEDGTRKIVGIKTDKNMDHFLIILDNIYHHGHIKTENGSPIPLGTIKSGVVQAAEGKELLVVTITAKEGEKYIVKDGSVWYRLSASNYRKTSLSNVYTERDLRTKIENQTILLMQQFNSEKRTLNKKIGTLQQDREELKTKFRNLEQDFEKIVIASKKTEYDINDFRNLLYKNILSHKEELEKEIEKESDNTPLKNWFSYLCCL